MSIELFDDDIELWKDEFSAEPWKVISNADVRNSSQLPTRISYEYVDTGCSIYGFDQPFTLEDSQNYFTCMKYISGKTIDELLTDEDFRLRRHSALHKPLKEALGKLSVDIIKGEPIIFHFGLYTIRLKWHHAKKISVRHVSTLCRVCMALSIRCFSTLITRLQDSFLSILLTIKARTGFLHTGQLPMSHNQGLRKEAVEFPKQFQQGYPLFHGPGVGRFSVRIQSAFIADADAATVKASGMCPTSSSLRWRVTTPLFRI